MFISSKSMDLQHPPARQNTTHHETSQSIGSGKPHFKNTSSAWVFLGCLVSLWFPVVSGTFLCFLCFTFAVVLVGVLTQASNTHQVFKNKTLFIAGLGKWKKKREALNHVERDESPQDIVVKQGEMIGSGWFIEVSTSFLGHKAQL